MRPGKISSRSGSVMPSDRWLNRSRRFLHHACDVLIRFCLKREGPSCSRSEAQSAPAHASPRLRLYDRRQRSRHAGHSAAWGTARSRARPCTQRLLLTSSRISGGSERYRSSVQSKSSANIPIGGHFSACGMPDRSCVLSAACVLPIRRQGAWGQLGCVLVTCAVPRIISLPCLVSAANSVVPSKSSLIRHAV
jgi:hypothetical protein